MPSIGSGESFDYDVFLSHSSRRLLYQALEAYKHSLTILSKEHLPGLWAIAYRNQGKVLLHLGRLEEAEAVFAELGEPVPELAEVSGDEAAEPGES